MQDKTLATLEKDLKARGERLTDPRRRVLAALLKQKKPQTAYDIVEKMKGMKPMSVYRALDFLAAQGLVHRIESLNAYVSCAEHHCTHKDSQYLICDGCGTVEELHNHAIDTFIAKNVRKGGFRITRKTLELHGTCGQCS